MRSAGAHDNIVGWIERAARAICAKDGNSRPWRQRNLGAGCKGFVDLDGDDTAAWSGELSEDGRVAACAAAEVKDCIARPHVEQVQMECPKARLAVIDVPRGVENNESVLIDAHRIGALSERASLGVLNQPWTRTDKALARNRGEGGQNRRRRDAIATAEFFGVETSHGFDRIDWRRLHFAGRRCLPVRRGIASDSDYRRMANVRQLPAGARIL